MIWPTLSYGYVMAVGVARPDVVSERHLLLLLFRGSRRNTLHSLHFVLIRILKINQSSAALLQWIWQSHNHGDVMAVGVAKHDVVSECHVLILL
jgi:hypothetical protein